VLPRASEEESRARHEGAAIIHDALFKWRRLVKPDMYDADVMSAEWALSSQLDDLLRLLQMTPRLNGGEVAYRVGKMFGGGS
jgi:hypothetical protein